MQREVVELSRLNNRLGGSPIVRLAEACACSLRLERERKLLVSC